MPELPDVAAYREALDRHVMGQPLQQVKVLTPFLLRSYDPPLETFQGRVVRGTRRIGKRLVLEFDDELFLVLHLMIAGRLRWRRPGQKPGLAGRNQVATFHFPNGTLHFTEAGTRKRASLTAIRGASALAAVDPGGIEPLEMSYDQFVAQLALENHTIKRSLTDPRLFSGIGNAYSDEILHAAQLSPLKQAKQLTHEEKERLYKAIRLTLISWSDILRSGIGEGFPEEVTAFRKDFAVHGKYGQPCPVCQSPVQRIVYAENECNYCARCQTGGKLLADRSLSRLLKDDWPKSIDDL
jgi:formamidopyrimidine-DNA glycosylase